MRKLLVAVLVLAALLVVGDRLAARAADRALADQLVGQLGVRPSVDVSGFPFLTQVVQGQYDDIEVRAANVRRGGVSLQSFTASLSGAQLPLADAVRGSVSAIPVRRLAASAVVSYAELARLAGKDVTVTADPAGVRVTGTFRVLGQDVSASAVSAVSLRGNHLVVRAGGLQVEGITATGVLGRALAGKLDLDLPLPALPYGVQLSAVQTGPAGVTVAGAASDVVLRR